MTLQIRYTYHTGTISHHTSWLPAPDEITRESTNADLAEAAANVVGKLYGPGQIVIAGDEEGAEVRIINGPAIDWTTYEVREVD